MFCADTMLGIIQAANDNQDSLWGLAHNQWHYNRDYISDETPDARRNNRATWRDKYWVYVGEQEKKFYDSLFPHWFGLVKKDCRGALETLGRLSHAWQDFYGHGIHSSGWDSGGFLLDSPDHIYDFWPSTFGVLTLSAEHPTGGFEPFFEPQEKSLRMFMAENYVTHRFREHVPQWITYCACDCNSL
jgi:hypothetical protein